MAGNGPTVAQLSDAFVRMATRNDPKRKLPVEVRVAYYAGCHAMLERVLTTLQSREANSADLAREWQSLADELTQFSDDYRAGKI